MRKRRMADGNQPKDFKLMKGKQQQHQQQEKKKSWTISHSSKFLVNLHLELVEVPKVVFKSKSWGTVLYLEVVRSCDFS